MFKKNKKKKKKKKKKSIFVNLPLTNYLHLQRRPAATALEVVVSAAKKPEALYIYIYIVSLSLSLSLSIFQITYNPHINHMRVHIFYDVTVMNMHFIFISFFVFNMISIPVRGISRDHIYCSRLVGASLRLRDSRNIARGDPVTFELVRFWVRFWAVSETRFYLLDEF